MEVGLRIKTIREAKNITQEKLAKKSKIFNQSQICKIENGQRSLKADELYHIAEILNIPVSQLLS